MRTGWVRRMSTYNHHGLPAWSERVLNDQPRRAVRTTLQLHGDPKLARFLQADPVIQFPHHAQSYNRYSYVLNNPLAYTDPSGYFIGKLFKKLFGGLNKLFGDFAPFLSIALLAIPGDAGSG